MFHNGNLDKLLRMMTTLLEKTDDNHLENLARYKEYAVELDKDGYDELINRIKNYEMCSYTLDEEYKELDTIIREYEQLRERQYEYISVYNKYSNDKLELSSLDRILIDKISKRKEDILGKLNCDNEISKCREELDNLSIKLGDEEKKRVMNQELIKKLEEQLRNEFLNAEGRFSSRVDGSNYTSVKSEYQENGMSIEQLLDNSDELKIFLNEAINNKNDKEGFEKAGIISYDVVPTKENKELLDGYHKDTVKAKYQLTLIKILMLVSDEANNYNDVKSKRIKLQDLFRYRVKYLKELGIDYLVDPFSRIRLDNQIEILDKMGDNSKEIVNITKNMGKVNSRLEQLVDDRNRLLGELNNKEEFIIDDLSMSQIALEISSTSDEDEKYRDNQVVKISSVPIMMNSRKIYEKTSGVLSRVNKMMGNVGTGLRDEDEVVSPQLVISPAEDNLEEIKDSANSSNKINENKIDTNDLFNVEDVPFDDVVAPLFKDRVTDDEHKDIVDGLDFLPKTEETNKKDGENIFEDMEMPVIEDQKSDNKEDLSFWPEKEKIVDNVGAGEISLDEQINNLLSNNNTLVKKKVA